MVAPIKSFNIFKFQISDIILTSAAWRESIVINKTDIKSLRIICNYDTAVAPQIYLDCEISYDGYYEILAQRDIEASFTISKSIIGNTTEESTKLGDRTLYSTRWLSCKLKVNDQGYLRSLDVGESILDKKNGHTPGSKKHIKLMMYDLENLKKVNEYHSFIIHGNQNDILNKILDSRRFKNCLVSSADSKHIDYTIPYGTLKDNLGFMNDAYGLFEYKPVFFMGLDRNYLIDRSKCGYDTEFNEIGRINIYVEESDQSDTQVNTNGSYEDIQNKVYMIATADVKIDNVDALKDFADGGSISYTIFGENGYNKEDIGIYNIERGYNLNNEINARQIINANKGSRRPLTATFSDIDISMICPNKLYKVISDKKYFHDDYDISGDYYLSSSEIVLAGNGSTIFTSSVGIVLGRIR